jgi:hypothetical protein
MRQRISIVVVVSISLVRAVDLSAQLPNSPEPRRVGAGQPSATVVHDGVLREAARLASIGATEPVSSEPDRSWAGRHPVLLGALVGLGGGLAFTAGTDCAHSSDYTCRGLSLWFGGIGAGIGAGVGGVVSLVRR